MKYIVMYVLLVGSIVFGIETLPNQPDSTCVITRVVAYLPHKRDTESVCECVDENEVKHSIVSNKVEFPSNIYYLHRQTTHLECVITALFIASLIFFVVWLVRGIFDF